MTYQADALRTEYTPVHARKIGRLLHAFLGLATELGEAADQLKKHLIYGKPLDEVNLVEEHGDFSWYSNLMIDAVGSTWEDSWAKNIAKLKVRFPDKFTQAQAVDRDLDAERAVLETPPDGDETSVTVAAVAAVVVDEPAGATTEVTP